MSLTATRMKLTFRLRSIVLRGLLAGVIAGAAAGGVALVTGESLIDQAIAIEETGTTTHSHEAGLSAAPADTEDHNHNSNDSAALVSRDGQRSGLFLATSLTGGATGVVFAILWFAITRKVETASQVQTVLPLAAAGWAAVAAVPWLLVPPNPPAVGSSGSIDYRTNLWVIAVLLGITAALTWYVVRRRAGSKVLTSGIHKSLPALAAAAVIVVGWRLLPGTGTDYTGFPADLLWNFRLASAATQLTLWAVLGIVFHGFIERMAQRR